MSIHRQVLGQVFNDNALHVQTDSGSQIYSLLFDCGENCLTVMQPAQIQKIDHLFLSHFHLDHFAGFDTFIRHNYNRETKPVHIWGPEGAADFIQHRLLGFEWNLLTELSTRWIIHEIGKECIKEISLYARERFREQHRDQQKNYTGLIFGNRDFRVYVLNLNHRIPSLGYIVCEQPRKNIRTEALDKLGLEPGPWLEDLKNNAGRGPEQMIIDGKSFDREYLEKLLLRIRSGSSIAYLTDFIYEADELKKQFQNLPAADICICEAQYLNEDRGLATINYHLTAEQAARIALLLKAKQLVLFHFSRRYRAEHLPDFLAQARAVFPRTSLGFDVQDADAEE